ncbi:NADH:ubiquinone reductase (Na(+)-transporting) subunit D [Pseudohalocynthiibacter aestuariivivens]|jgi:Na+-transporting NADH:ubiquinone oxidoreductase subunit D|uniref:NADH:ubiquinone reductase (Na(+)-transporting) subunit D n=1 Tax=Pseudohalocynthiibacter aestuariivivens TaxID=1591409 RepID=A0ABV5JIN7_9RHOB|nr:MULTISPECIES: NADH:ubiquinone reductase (Na(+)-transporting) subunit D [Pseudohalocynthiibacter]MBS9716553.1 NADH:ubiquinone reductase (Na(+)-transporting) subunit D [Pseudohalocynthiibacter aestuariivivens]MCK0101623.1 NADH:ubiquinone reductase (Na(+)-transporting) subunit D [Pseudohalocynthiibacter sp. F2068]
MKQAYAHLTDPLIKANPITLHILGICSALAVTTSVSTALTMSAALTVVLVLSSAMISAIRHHMPTAIRLIVQITIIASLVIVMDLFLKAFAFEMSKRLSIFVGLIVTNCLVLGRAEAFARRNPVWPSVLDALGNGLGYSIILLTVGTIRELFGVGTLLGYEILPLVENGGWFRPMHVMLLAPSAFFIVGFLVWVIRSLRPEQAETPEFRILSHDETAQS